MARAMSSRDLELIEAPLSSKELAERYRDLCYDRRFANVPGKVELDVWGRVLMTPASAYHAQVQGRICQKLAVLGGEILVEPGIATATGLFVPDITWATLQFVAAHAGEIALTRAPEICIEVVSPSNSVKEMEEKRVAYLATGAQEVWIVYPQSKRCEFYGPQGPLAQSAYPIDWVGVFA
jgi:Uma2 family endonuclease